MDTAPAPTLDSPPEAFVGILRATGLSQAQVARTARLHPSVLNRFLRGKAPLSHLSRVRLLAGLDALLYSIWRQSPPLDRPTALLDGRQESRGVVATSPVVREGAGVSNRRFLARAAAFGAVEDPELVGRRLEDLPDVLTVEDLARLFGCSPSTIRRRVHEGHFPLPPMAAIDYRYRWSRLQVRRWLEKGGPLPSRRPARRGR